MQKLSSKRFREILKVFAKYGLGEKNPQNIRKAFEELGPTFIKIGQILSTRSDIFPPSYIDEFVRLQDNVYPESLQSIREVFEGEFNVSLEDSFKFFSRVPLASASISQVHKAILKDGREVIVKIQRPDIKDKMEQDIHILKKIIKLNKKRFDASPIDVLDALDEIWSASRQELDFENEKNNINLFNSLNCDVAFIHTPFVVSELSSNKVLTLENIDGFKIDNLELLTNEGYDLEDISRKLAIGFLKQVFVDGFFHGDPHPGNILIKDTKICFIDFGIMGKLPKPLRESLNDAIISIAFQDVDKLMQVFLSIGIRKGQINKNALYEDLDYMFHNYLNTSLSNINISVILDEILTLAKRNNIQLPKELTLVMKSFILLEGIISKLCPEIKILDIAIPYIKGTSSLIPNITFDDLVIKAYSLFKDTYKLPSKMVSVSDSILSGRAKIQMEHKNLDKPLASLNKMVNRMVFGLVISAMILGSCLILTSNIGPKVYGISIIGIMGFGMSGIFGLLLIISILKSGLM